MNRRELETALAAANPVQRDRLDQLDFEAMEADLLADLSLSPGAGSTTPGAALTLPAPSGGDRHRPRRLALALGAAILVAIGVLVASLGGGTSEHPTRAYAAELVRFAESSPLLLLEGPGWRVQNANEYSRGEGTMEFVTGKPIPYESIRITGNDKTGERESGMFPPAVRQRRVELAWRQEDLGKWLRYAHSTPHPHGQHWIRLPVLGTMASVDTRAEFFVNQGGPGNRQMVAFWSEGGYLLELRAAVPDLAAFEERLNWLTRVDSQTWLDAMPAKVVKASDHDAAVREMLKGIPVPSTFNPSLVPDEGLTTARYQVGASVTGIVSCLWFRQWGEARRNHDKPAEVEAEKAMATSRHWPILHEMAKDGAYPATIWQLAAAMPSGHWDWGPHHWRLLPRAEGLGCARWGMPVLPWKQRRQQERAEAPQATRR